MVAGALVGRGLGIGAANPGTYAWAGPAASIPVALALAWWSLSRPVPVALAIIGLLTFGTSLIAMALTGNVQPVPVAIFVTLSAGVVSLTSRLAKPLHIVEAITLMCAASAFIFEVAISLHNL